MPSVSELLGIELPIIQAPMAGVQGSALAVAVSNAAAPPFPIAMSAILSLRAKAEAQGSGDFSPLWAGQNVSGCKAIPAAELTHQLIDRVSRS